MGIYVDALMEKNSLYLRFLFAEIINRGKNMGLDINDFNLTQCLLSACRIYMAARKVKNQSSKNMNQIYIICRNHLDIV